METTMHLKVQGSRLFVTYTIIQGIISSDYISISVFNMLVAVAGVHRELKHV